ncbi:MAG: hypothetical protein LC664_00325 [Flavobacteriales bacterium]|nr:hypothetical protein [Flavobacteriales bacterium]
MKKYVTKENGLRLVAVLLGLFFIYAGAKKLFVPPEPRTDGHSTVPAEFIDLIRAFKGSGYFMIMVAWFQLTAGALLLWKRTMLIGALLLLPVTFNIFAIHVALDNRMGEYIFTGILLAANSAIVLTYLRQLILPARLKTAA